MSSLEIAELTGKQHKNVLVDIRKMFNELQIDEAEFSAAQIYGNNNTREIFNLNEELSLTLVSGYNIKMRNAIIKRWQELESQNQIALPNFNNPAEAARAWADEVESTQAAINTIKERDKLIIASNEASIKAGEILVREFVKAVDIINIGEKLFYHWMREQGYLLKDSCQPYQQYVKRGFFTWKPSEDKHGGKFRYTLRITARGKIWLAARYMAYLDSELDAA